MDNDSSRTRQGPGEQRSSLIDWLAAFDEDFGATDFLPGKLGERGQQVAVVGNGKVGKSLLMHDFILSAATGRDFLGDKPERPIRTVYFDRENNLRDIMRNLRSLGATEADLKALTEQVIYHSFPGFSSQLDHADGARELLSVVLEIHQQAPVDLVVLDTASRFVAGRENDADTWLALYRLVHAELKGRDIACWRLDHFGKDQERGARGSSAKTQDIDHEWQLIRLGERTTTEDGIATIATTLRLFRSDTRSGVGPGVFELTRVGKQADGIWLPGQTRHGLTAASEVAEREQYIQSFVAEYIAAGVPAGLGLPRLRAWVEQHPQVSRLPAKNEVAGLIVKALKEQLPK